MLIDLQNCCQVVASVTVIRCAEDCGHLVVMFVGIAFVHQLVGSCDHAELVRVAEFLCYVLSYEGFY